MDTPFSQNETKQIVRLALIWLLILAVSMLPDILANEVFTLDSAIPFWFKIIVVGLVMIFSAINRLPKAIQHLAMMLLAFHLLTFAGNQFAATDIWQGWFDNATFVNFMLGNQVLKIAVALVMLIVLLFLGYSRHQAYLTSGKLSAPVEAIPLLAIKRGEITWRHFGWLSALAIGAGTTVFLLLGSQTALKGIAQLLPLLPFVLLFATMNAFAEEVTFRVALMTPLRTLVSRHQMVWLTALYFGIAHFYGVPYGLAGIAMATVLGWLLGKSMVETDGFFWPWFIHFVQDVLIFSFIAIGFTTPMT